MTRTRKQAHDAHSRERRGQAQRNTQGYVADRPTVFPALDQTDGLHAESRERCEAAAKPDDQQRPHVVVGLDVHELPDEDPDEEAAGDVHEQGAERESVRGKMLYSAAYQITEYGTSGSAKCDE